TWRRLARLRSSLARRDGSVPSDWSAHLLSLAGHLAAALLLAAVALRPAVARQGPIFTLLPGVPFTDTETGLLLKAGEPTVDLDAAGRLRDVRVPIMAMSDGSTVISATAGLAQPLALAGYRLSLKGYGPAAAVVSPDGTAFALLDGDQPAEVALPTAGVSLRLALQTRDHVLIEAWDPAGLRQLDSSGLGSVASGG